MIIVIPLLTTAAYLLSWWVTVRVVNAGDSESETEEKIAV